MSSAYDLTHDPKYTDLVVLEAARELLAERGANTESLEGEIWSIRAAETPQDLAKECATCGNTGRVPVWNASAACEECAGSGYVVEADE